MPLYDEDGNEVEGALTQEEVEEKVEQAKQEQTKELKDQLEDKEQLLSEAQEELEKEKEKGKNFGKARKKIGKKEDEVKDLQETVSELEEKIGEVKQSQQKSSVKKVAEKMAGGDSGLANKIFHFYNSFQVPEDDTEKKRNKRWENAYLLATNGKRSLPADAVKSGGTPPHEEKSPGKLEDQSSKEVGKKLGLKEKEQKKHGLI